MADSPIQTDAPKKLGRKGKGKVKLLPMGILSVVATILSFVGIGGVGWVGLALGIGSIIEGRKALKDDPNNTEAKPAIILGIVALVLFVVGFGLSMYYVLSGEAA